MYINKKIYSFNALLLFATYTVHVIIIIHS